MALDLILFTPPQTQPDEVTTILSLLDAGVDRLHVRKPEMGKQEFLDYLKQIPARYYRKVVIHSHYDLIAQYNFGGIHLTGTFLKQVEATLLKELIAKAKMRRIDISTSVHSVEELSTLPNYYKYTFLSPVFDSISKKDYPQGIDHAAAKAYLGAQPVRKIKVYALGGINSGNLSLVKSTGFDGAAILGALWNADGDKKALWEEIVQLS